MAGAFRYWWAITATVGKGAMFYCACGSKCASSANFCTLCGHQINDAIEQTSTDSVDAEELIIVAEEGWFGQPKHITRKNHSTLCRSHHQSQVNFQLRLSLGSEDGFCTGCRDICCTQQSFSGLQTIL